MSPQGRPKREQRGAQQEAAHVSPSPSPSLGRTGPARPLIEAEIAQRVQRHWHEAVPQDRMAHLIKDATRALQRALSTRLAPHGVQFGHWSFLRILWQREGLTQRELSIEAGVMEPTTSIALRAMVALGHVRLEQRAANRKNVYVVLTPLGRSLQASLVPLAEEVNALALQGLSATDVATTRRALLVMVDNLAREAAALAQAPASNDRARLDQHGDGRTHRDPRGKLRTGGPTSAD